MLTALVTVAMIGSWRGRTFLDDNMELDDVRDFVPADEPSPTPTMEAQVLAQTARPDLELPDPPSRGRGRTFAA
jgi:hypothetical protein